MVDIETMTPLRVPSLLDCSRASVWMACASAREKAALTFGVARPTSALSAASGHGRHVGRRRSGRMGLVQDITAPGKQLDRAIEIAERVAAAAPLGVRATLAFAHQSLSGEEPALAALVESLAAIFQSEDAKEARRAAQEGRAPVFQGK
jgi:hypothetical protein